MSFKPRASAIAAVLLALIVVSDASAQEPVDTLTLEQALELAQRSHPAIVQARGAISTAEAAERTRLGAYLPSLSVSAGSSLASTERFSSETNTITTGSSDSYRAGLDVGYDLFTGGRRGAQRTQAQAETVAAEAGLVEQSYAVSLLTKQSFFGVLRAEDLIRVAQARVERAEEGLAAAEHRLNLGSATQSDVLRARIELNAAREALLNARNQRSASSLELGRLVGATGPVAAHRSESYEPRPLPLSDAEILASVVESPAIRSSRAAVRAADAGVSVARAQYFPGLRVSTGYDWFNQDATLSDGRTSWSAGIGLSYPIFNGFQREEAVERARVQIRVAEAQLRDAERLARANAQRALEALNLAAERISLAAEAVDAANEDLRVQRERYRVGASTMLDVLTSQTALAEAETSLVAARFDYQIARAELESLLGRTL